MKRRRPHRRVHLIPGGRDGEGVPGIYLLPNLFTTVGLFLGFYAVIATSRGDFWMAAICIVAAHVCDGLDGRIARLTQTTSAFGVEYDSVADLVSFGVAPAFLAYRWALIPWGAWGWLAASLFVACGALRLARFNVLQSVTEPSRFTGLPIPAAADMVASTVLLFYHFGGQGAATKRVLLLAMVYGLAVLMVSQVPYSSFKKLNMRARQPLLAFAGLLLLVTLLAAKPEIVLFTALACYVVSGPVLWALGRSAPQSQPGAGQVGGGAGAA